MYETILVPIDDSESADETLEHAIDLADAVDATVHVLTVVESGGSRLRFGVTQVDDLNRAASRLVEDVVAAHEGHDVEVRGEVRRGRPAKVILEYADEVDADLVVVGQRGAGLEEALLGSTTDRLARLSSIPVTIVPRMDDDE